MLVMAAQQIQASNTYGGVEKSKCLCDLAAKYIFIGRFRIHIRTRVYEESYSSVYTLIFV